MRRSLSLWVIYCLLVAGIALPVTAQVPAPIQDIALAEALPFLDQQKEDSTVQNTPLLDGIQWEGLDRIRLSYLERFVESRIGTPIDSAMAELDAKRLRRLDGVANAEVVWRETDAGMLLVFQIEEAWTLYPIANLGGVEGNFWWQAGATELNLAGRGITVAADLRVTDRRLGGQLYVRLPYLLGSPWGISVAATRQASLEPFFISEQTVQYRYTNHTVELLGIREIQPGHIVEAGGALLLEDYSLDDAINPLDIGAPDELSQTKALIKTRWVLDVTDRRYFWRDGWLLESLGTLVLTPGDDPFFLWLSDAHAYRRTGLRGNWAGRLRLGVASNTTSPFAPFVLDSRLNIRGSGNRVDRGTATVVLNGEYRHAFVNEKRVALQVVGFVDAGSWRSPGGAWKDLIDPDQFRLFAGAGMRLIWKQGVDAQLRIDYGINPMDPSERGLVIGLGPYF